MINLHKYTRFEDDDGQFIHFYSIQILYKKLLYSLNLVVLWVGTITANLHY